MSITLHNAYEIPKTLILLYQEPEGQEEDFTEEFNPAASKTIALFDKAMAEFKPIPANDPRLAPVKRKRRAKHDGLVVANFSATYCLSTDAARYTRAITSRQKQSERMIRDMEKLRHKHELAGKHDVTFTQFTKDITKGVWEMHPEDPRKQGYMCNMEEHYKLDNKFPKTHRTDLVRVEKWATLTIKRFA